MKEITFRYRDEMSNWEWRTQHCTVETVNDCIKIYDIEHLFEDEKMAIDYILSKYYYYDTKDDKRTAREALENEWLYEDHWIEYHTVVRKQNV